MIMFLVRPGAASNRPSVCDPYLLLDPRIRKQVGPSSRESYVLWNYIYYLGNTSWHPSLHC